ncbi:MAG: RIP metalloprotease RseP [Candidatus Krumholzibacteria bacterium]|nr:RIP metalloprotease RseP [Candidatus Krumholzibacteria bacterium]
MNSDLMITLLASVFTLGLVVIVHELGHFSVCKVLGIFVKTFSVGMGPKILVRRWGETEYALSLIPFGGYVKMAGEGMMEEIQDTGTREQKKYPLGTEEGNRERAGADRDIPPDRQFLNRPPWQRFLVFISGPLFNLVLAYVIYTSLFLHQGIPVNPITEIGTVAADSPAAAAGLRVGDVFLSVDGQPVSDWYDMLDALDRVAGGDQSGGPVRPVPVVVARDGGEVHTEIQLERDAAGRWQLGIEAHDNLVGRVQRNGPAARLGLKRGDRIVMIDGQPVRSHREVLEIVQVSAARPLAIAWERDGRVLTGTVTPVAFEVQADSLVGRIHYEKYQDSRPLQLSEALTYGHRQTWFTLSQTARELWRWVRERMGLESVGGPIRIAQVAGEMARWGFDRLLFFIAFFSVNLFLLNMLPIPVLDGGHVLFLIFEVLRGKPVDERVQGIATQLGLIILLLFMTVVLVQDGVRLFTG